MSAAGRACEPFVFGPALAMDRMPAPVCFSSCHKACEERALGLCRDSKRKRDRLANAHPCNLVLELLAVDALAAAPRAGRVTSLVGQQDTQNSSAHSFTGVRAGQPSGRSRA